MAKKITQASRNEFINEIANWLPRTQEGYAQTTTPKALSSLLLILETQGIINFVWEQEENQEKFFIAKTRDEKILFKRSLRQEDKGTLNLSTLKEIIETQR
jgi:hypothetical protein